MDSENAPLIEGPGEGQWIRFKKDGPQYLAPFVSTPGSCQACIDNGVLKRKLINAGALLKWKAEWFANVPKFLRVITEGE